MLFATDLETKYIVVALPCDVLDVGGEKIGKPRQRAEAMTPAASSTLLNPICCCPSADCLHLQRISRLLGRQNMLSKPAWHVFIPSESMYQESIQQKGEIDGNSMSFRAFGQIIEERQET